MLSSHIGFAACLPCLPIPTEQQQGVLQGGRDSHSLQMALPWCNCADSREAIPAGVKPVRSLADYFIRACLVSRHIYFK